MIQYEKNLGDIEMKRVKAEELLRWVCEKNPGPWTEHSLNVARAAEKIAGACRLDTERAYVCGLLHDIGRYEGVTDLRHILAGYELLNANGFDETAGGCLTHSFAYKDIKAHSGRNDCGPEQTAFIVSYLSETEYDDYDKLIQLCDSLASADGFCLIETRLTDVARRYGFNEFTLKKWDATYEIKKYFDNLCGRNIYGLFYDEIVENIFK